MVSPVGDSIPDLPDLVIKVGNLEAPCEDRKLMLLKASNRVDNGLTGG